MRVGIFRRGGVVGTASQEFCAVLRSLLWIEVLSNEVARRGKGYTLLRRGLS